ncbi:MAG: PAS domain S-box protein [Chloroflexi bacterium]|nr:PAS domain S-box protein [Chloroflexota bacterium]
MIKKPEKKKVGVSRGVKSSRQENAERDRGFFDAMAEGYAHCRIVHENGQAQDWVFLAVNNSFEKLTGLSGVEGKHATEVMPDFRKTLPGLLETCSRVSQTGQPEKFEMFVEALQTWFSVSVFSPEKECFAAIFNVITERKQVETKLRESMEYFRTVANFTYDWEYWLDSRRRILYTSPSCERITGYEVGKFEQDPSLLEKIVHPNDRPLYKRHMQEEVEKAEPLSLDFRIVATSGDVRWISHACQRVHGPDGRPMGRRASNRDITQRRQAEQALRENEATLSMAEEVAQMGSWRLDLRTKKATWSEQMFRLFGVERECFDGDMNRVVAERVHPDDVSSVLEFNRSILGGISSVASLTYRIVLPNGVGRTVRAHGKLIRDEAGQPTSMIGYVQDITEWAQVKKQTLQMKRLYVTLSQVNQILMQVKEPSELYQSVCDVVVQHGEIAAAWVGLLDEDSQELKPVAANGLDVKNWAPLVVDSNGRPSQNGVIVEAFRTSKPATSEDVQTDERTRDLRELKKYDLHSLASIPFRVQGRTVGVLNLLSREVGFFQAGEEIHLLEKMGLAISFAHDKMETEKVKLQWADAFENCAYGIAIGLPTGRILTCNPAFARLQGRTIEEVSSMSILEMYDPSIHEYVKQCIAEADCTGHAQYEARMIRKDGSVYPVQMDLVSVRDENGNLSYRVATQQDASGRKQTEEALHQSEEKMWSIFRVAPTGIGVVKDRVLAEVNARICEMTGYTKEELIGQSARILYPTHEDFDFVGREKYRQIAQRGSGEVETRWRKKDGSIIDVLLASTPIDVADLSKGVTFTALDITERKRAEEVIRRSEQQMKALVTSLDDIVFEFDEDGNYLDIWTADESLLVMPKAQMMGRRVLDVMGEEHGSQFAKAIKRSLAENSPQHIEYPLEVIGGQRWFMARANPILVPGNSRRAISVLVRDITEHRKVEEQVQIQLRRMRALNEIDRAISSSLDMRLSLDVLLTQTISQLGVDAACVLLLSPSAQTLEYSTGKGFRSTVIRQSRMLLGQDLPGQAGLERKTIHASSLELTGGKFLRQKLLADEGFVEYLCVPLIAKGLLKGVLEIFNRSPLNPDMEWMNYLETLGGQAAIAIDNAQLFEGMQRSNLELIVAYDATIEGWSRAMDLRDKETEGHTLRVTDWTIKLAKAMGVNPQEIAHMRRGALLHDIGKLGVPDHILYKTDGLDRLEWAVMREHPTYAFNMLLPIAYLRPALDIPYCHHEKWDGSGYPRGLKGEEIPLAARIFAVVDVWDALRSDRPYRKGWTTEQIREYLIAESGKHFDPQVVDAFLMLLETE